MLKEQMEERIKELELQNEGLNRQLRLRFGLEKEVKTLKEELEELKQISRDARLMARTYIELEGEFETKQDSFNNNFPELIKTRDIKIMSMIEDMLSDRKTTDYAALYR